MLLWQLSAVCKTVGRGAEGTSELHISIALGQTHQVSAAVGFVSSRLREDSKFRTSLFVNRDT